jgi:hypothetical protein
MGRPGTCPDERRALLLIVPCERPRVTVEDFRFANVEQHDGHLTS